MTATTDMKARVSKMLGKTGYSGGGGGKNDTTRPTSGPDQVPKPLERADGGAIPGDDDGARARGGKAGSRGHGKKGGKTNVNVIVAPPHPPGPPGGMMPPPGLVKPPMAGPPPGAGGPPPGGLPPGLPPGGPGLPPGAGGPPGAPMMKPPGMKKGGKIDDGAGSGPGRLEKTKAYGGR